MLYNTYILCFSLFVQAPEEYYCSAVHSGKVTPYRFVKDECNRNFNFSAVYSSVSDILTGTMDNKASRTYTINNYFRPKLTAMNRFYDYILHHKYGKDSMLSPIL